ncbi:MAG: exodeoxyribonuclease VII small subunit [Proteobacteria bacterium]|nr:exodeoxyribonuclease VII small subunit [Pseudomonadota bacterium]
MKKNNFEKDLKGLEEIVTKLEGDEVSLDEAMALFEEGVKLSRLCAKKLDEAEHKVEILTKDKDGEFKAEPFEPDEK